MAWYFILWIVVAVVVALGATVLCGFFHDELDEDPFMVVVGAVMTVVLFPAILFMGVAAMPFIVLYAIGKHLKNLRNKKV